ncbi:MAG: glycosyltransferase family A protein [Ottowia sp.]|uniref:glycosyltransferase family 2 protein n=1 Tax=unclassified Ottowia TaxID=2645081 RepID=UPI003C2AB290
MTIATSQPSPLLVSVIVTCYNRQAYLAEALDSILAQRFTGYEIVLVDDGSTDDSARIAAEYAERHRGCLRYHHQPNQGAAAAKNSGVQLAAGRYLAFLDSDDIWTPEKLETQMRDAGSRPDIRIRYAHGRQFLSPELAPDQRARLHCPEQPMPAPTTGTLLIERADFLRIGGFRSDLRVGIDIEWHLRARASGMAMATLPEVLLLRRVHPGNSGFTERDARKQHSAILKEHLDRIRARAPSR